MLRATSNTLSGQRGHNTKTNHQYHDPSHDPGRYPRRHREAGLRACLLARQPHPRRCCPEGCPGCRCAEGEATIASLREQGRQLIKAGKNAEFKAALTSVGADSITTLDPSKYNDLSVTLAAILTPAEAPEGDGL